MSSSRKALVASLSVVLAGVFSTGTAQATPTLDQTSPIIGNGGGAYVWSSQTVTQTFTAGITGELTSVDIGLRVQSGSTANLTVRIETTASGMPTGTALASRTFNASQLTGITSSTQWFSVQFTSPPVVTAGTMYAIVAASNDGTATLIWPSGGSYAGGSEGGGGSGDVPFATYVNPLSSVSTNDMSPTPVVQEFGKPASGTCDAGQPAGLNWAGVPSGGWANSWAQWMNDGTGGFVCTRTLVYSMSQAKWVVG